MVATGSHSSQITQNAKNLNKNAIRVRYAVRFWGRFPYTWHQTSEIWKDYKTWVVLTVSRFPWKAALQSTCKHKEKTWWRKRIHFPCSKNISQHCSGPALCDTSSDIFISHFYSLRFLPLLYPSSSDLTSLESQNKALIHLTKALGAPSKKLSCDSDPGGASPQPARTRGAADADTSHGSHNYCLPSAPRGALPCPWWSAVVQNFSQTKTYLWVAKTCPWAARDIFSWHFPATSSIFCFSSHLESTLEGETAEIQYWNNLLFWSHRTSSWGVSQGVSLRQVPAHLRRSKSGLWIRGRTPGHLSAAGGSQKNRSAKSHSCLLFTSLIHNSYFRECYELWDWEICKLPGLLPKSQVILSLGNRATSAHRAARSSELWVLRSPRTSNTSGEASGRAGKQWYLPSSSPWGLQRKVFITRELL